MKQLGKYEILEELGRGGFGTVYRARETILDVERAVKILHPNLVNATEFLERFRREAKVAASLDHPGIVPVYEFSEEQGYVFLAMKYMPGGSLKELLAKQGCLPFERALEILRQAAAGLEYAHTRPGKIIHRDLKPGNLLFDEDGHARVSDFGFAKALSGMGGASASSVSGGVVGTPAYIAPEVWSAKPASPATDVYSLACLFFEMITGKALFDGKSPVDIMKRHVLDGPQFPAEWPEGTPAGLEAVLRKALAKEPGERYPGAGDFAAALEELSHPAPQTVRSGAPGGAEKKPPHAAPAKPRPASRIKTLLPWLAGVGLLVLIAASWLLIPDKQVQEQMTPTTTPVDPTPQLEPMTAILTPPPDFLEDQPQETVTAYIASSLGEAALRESPPSGEVIAYLKDGDPVEVIPGALQTETGQTWVPVQAAVSSQESRGWVLASLLRLPAPTGAPTPTKPQERDGMQMVYIPEGLFLMGSEEGADDESPEHLVYLDAYWMDSTEVTNAMYARCAQVGACRPVSIESPEDHPVVNVSWEDALDYCAWAGRRLPTEAEWEKAARGAWNPPNEPPTYPWGDTLNCDRANYYDCGTGGTTPVGSYPTGASPYGLLDMAGNVREWVADWHAGDYYANSPSSNPSGPATGEYRALRGGSWGGGGGYLRSAGRSWNGPADANNNFGFRCARSH